MQPAYSGASSKSTPSPTIAARWQTDVDAAQRVVDGVRVADVAVHELEAGVTGEGRDAAGMDTRQQGVKHPYLMTRAGERLDNVGPDEAGAAGHKYSHAG